MSSCSVVVNLLDYDILVSEFEFHSYYVHFRTNTLGKGIPQAMGEIVSLLTFYKDGFGIK